MINIEQNLREICRRKGLRLSDVADRIGAGQSNLVSSVKGNPELSTLQDIAEALNISISELLTMRPATAEGIAFIGGQTYQLSKPAATTVQLPSYDRYDTLRDEIKEFIMKSTASCTSASKMGLLETLEVFSLVYDHNAAKFTLSLCYAEGKTLTFAYDKLEFCEWNQKVSEGDAPWDIKAISEEIINDIEGRVPMILQSE